VRWCRVAVADDLEVEVVGVPAAGEHGVQLLPGLLPGHQAMHGVGGDALRTVNSGGVAQTGRLPHIVTRQPDGQLAAGVPDRELTAAVDMGDHPAFPVLDPVGGRKSESSVVHAGDDHITDTRPVSIPQTHLLPGRATVKAMITGSTVELSDQLAGRSQQDRVQSGRSIMNPSSKGIVSDLGEITDMDTTMIEIEAECAGITVPQGERGLSFGRVAEAV
jgi:hypothetical protein